MLISTICSLLQNRCLSQLRFCTFFINIKILRILFQILLCLLFRTDEVIFGFCRSMSLAILYIFSKPIVLTIAFLNRKNMYIVHFYKAWTNSSE